MPATVDDDAQRRVWVRLDTVSTRPGQPARLGTVKPRRPSQSVGLKGSDQVGRGVSVEARADFDYALDAFTAVPDSHEASTFRARTGRRSEPGRHRTRPERARPEPESGHTVSRALTPA